MKMDQTIVVLFGTSAVVILMGVVYITFSMNSNKKKDEFKRGDNDNGNVEDNKRPNLDALPGKVKTKAKSNNGTRDKKTTVIESLYDEEDETAQGLYKRYKNKSMDANAGEYKMSVQNIPESIVKREEYFCVPGGDVP